MARLFLLLLALGAHVACGGSERVLPADAGRDARVVDDSGVIFADGGDDGGTDGGPDASTDAGPDSGTDGGPDSGTPKCTTSALCPSCPDEATVCDDLCPTGQVCLPSGCEDIKRCFTIGGGACDDDGDCGDPNYACDLTISRCLRTSPGCNSSIDCVPGFACEGGSCVDRRVPCDGHADCPHGYTCRQLDDDQRFCRRLTRPCERNTDCLALGVPCGDPDGDGNGECMPSLNPGMAIGDGGFQLDAGTDLGQPCANTECTSGGAPVCEPEPQGTRAQCGQHGPCQTTLDCAPTFVCLDLWGDGRAECVPTGGDCTDTSECPERQVCASSRAGGAPTCHGGAGT